MRTTEALAALLAGEAEIDGETVEVSAQGPLADLAAREPERVFAKSELLRAVWGYRSGGSTRTVDSHASRLRRKLGDPRVITTRPGVGYRIADPAPGRDESARPG